MKKLGLLFLATLVFATVNAQTDPTCKYQLSPKYYQANWFISGAVGAQVMLGSGDGLGDFDGRMTPQFELFAGKWFSNIWGARVGFTGYNLKGYSDQPGAGYITGITNDLGVYKQKFNYWNPHMDVMFNFSAAVCKNQRHVYEAIPYVGVGYAYSFMHSQTNGPSNSSLSVNAGLINTFHVSNDLDLNINLNATGVSKYFDQEASDLPFKGMGGVTFGATFKL